MSLVDESLTQWKSRLGEIEKQIGPLVAEADELRQAIAKVETAGGGATPTQARARPASRRRQGARKTSAAAKPARGKRAPRGANRTQILEAIATEAKTAGQVAKETGIGRGTVATTLTKLARDGQAVKADRGYLAAA